MDVRALCRCCHNEGVFESLNTNNSILNMTYNSMLEETFNIIIYKNSQEKNAICPACMVVLQDSYLFKKQVLLCEEKLKLYCQNSILVRKNSSLIKLEVELDNGDSQFTNDCKDDVIPKVEYQKEKHSIDSGKQDVSNIEVKVFETDHNNRESTIRLSENSQANRSTVRKDIKKKRVVKKDRENNARKRVRKKDIAGKKIKPLISRQFIDESLINPLQTESSLIYSCLQCSDRTFKNRFSILSHISNYHTGAHKCPKCDHLCPNGYELRAHYRKHFQKLFNCKICGVTCSSRYNLKEHNVKHLNCKSFKCDACSKEFKYKSSLKVHMFEHSGGRPRYLCDICGVSFNDVTNLKIHERSVHLKLRPFTCDHCKLTYSAKKHLKLHIITKHLDIKEFTCSFCTRTFATKSSCLKHEAVHTKVFECCNKVFDSKREYLSHIKKFNCKTKLGCFQNKYMKSKSCEVCGKVFATKFTWRRHMSQKHDSDRTRKFLCDICQQKFYDSFSVYRHKFKRHIPNIIQFKTKCSICHKSYKNMDKHIQSHSNTPYDCNVCGKRFSEVSARNRHFKYVHSGQRLVCSICNKGYKEEGALKRHRLKAHNVKVGNDFDDYMSSYIIDKGDQ